MIKSLYVRVTLVFIGTVFLSLLLTFLIANRLYGVQSIVLHKLIDGGDQMIKSYAALDPVDREVMMEGVSALPDYAILIFNQDGQLLHHGDPNEMTRLHIGEDELQQVLNGGVIERTGTHNLPLVAGLPFEADNKPYAFFIAPEISGIPFHSMIITILILVFLFGCLFILVAARFLVRPLQMITKASRKMAKGDFNVQLEIRSKDEIGQLANSFNRMAQELGALEAVRQQFVSDVSHEFQSPLTSIKGFAQAIRYKKMDDATKDNMLAIIEEEATRLSRLSSDLLQLSNLEYEHLVLQISSYRLDEQLRHVIMASEPLWSAKGQEIELQTNEMTIQADKDRLNQLWTNLLSNAIKFSPREGRIRIVTHGTEATVKVSILDSGPGIPDEEFENIFKPFYKIDKSRDRTEPGSGIGLSIVKRIIEIHGGEIKVTSRLGEGTDMLVVLPLYHRPHDF